MYHSYPRAHLLSLPIETRDNIYAEILKQIQLERHSVNGNPVSSYDGLRLTCTQLHNETQKSVFCYRYTSRQLTRTLDFKLDRTNFLNVRSVSLEIPLNVSLAISQGIIAFFHQAQLSLQELHLFFIGKDGKGVRTNMCGCGKKDRFATPHDVSLLLDGGQNFEQQWALIREIALLRNLRVLEIENANLPLTAGLLCHNKPHLKCLTVTSDQRSVSCSLTRMERPEVMYLFRNLSFKVPSFPHVRMLSLNANSAPDAEGIVNGISPTLRHLSWRVPNPDLQPYPLPEEKSFYKITNRLIEALSWRAPRLATLRLCISMRERENRTEQLRQDFGVLTDNLSVRLHLFSDLKHLEIHFRGDQGPGGFFKTGLIGRLPLGLSRLYLSDSTISVTDLVKQVRIRYFTYFEDLNMILAAPTPIRGQSFLNGRISCGEIRDRNDDVPLAAGDLGFINFEYSCTEADEYIYAGSGEDIQSENGTDCYSGADDEEEDHARRDRTEVLRLNGQLLDREHNLHLVGIQNNGIEPHQAVLSPSWSWSESANWSRYDEILHQLWKVEGDTIPNWERVRCNIQGLEESIRCLDCNECKDRKDRREYEEVELEEARKAGEDVSALLALRDLHNNKEKPFHTHRDRYWDWYFGNETEAEAIFRTEAVANVEDQKQKPNLMEVEVCESQRCRWECPDYEVPPVGSFVEPQIPADWRDCVCE